MADRWPDIRAGHARRVNRGKRASRTIMRDVPKKLEQPDENWVGCAVCLNQKSRRVKADTIVAGYAVCQDHIQLAEQPGFSVFKLRSGERRPV